MTALAGVIGPATNERLCRAILSSQTPYGSAGQSVAASKSAALGISPALLSPHQDAASEGNRWIAVADIRLDNQSELCRMLGLAENGQSFSDAKVLLKLWDREGEQALQHLLGDFAIAIYDRRQRALTLARDPTGQLPLFFKVRGGDLVFASMPSGIRDIFGRSGLDKRMLASHLANREHAGSETFFERIERVRPGEILRFERGQVSRRIWWTPALYPSAAVTGDDLVEQYRELLDLAVAGRMAGQSRLGSHLSSGFDSSAVTTTAARLLGPSGELTAFTSAPLAGSSGDVIRHWFADESALAAETAKMHGIRHVIIRETAPLFDVLRRQTKLVQAPLWAPTNAGWWAEIRRQAAELGIATILTGESGNLTLSAGGLSTLATYVRAGRLRSWWHETRSLKRSGSVRWRGIAISSFGSWLPDFAWNASRRLFLGIPARSRVSFLQTHWREELGLRGSVIRPNPDPYANRLEALRLGDMGPYRKAAIADHGIPELDPTADRRLIEFSLALPPEQLLHNGISKPLARAALADRVPRSVLNTTQRGMQGSDWHLRVNAGTARQVLEQISPHSMVQEILDLPRLESAITAWPQADFNSYRTMAVYRNALISALATGIFIDAFER